MNVHSDLHDVIRSNTSIIKISQAAHMTMNDLA